MLSRVDRGHNPVGFASGFVVALVTPEESRLVGSGELGMVQHLLPWIALDKLGEIRRLLRDGRRWPHETPTMRLQRADLLDLACRLMVAAGEAPAEYLVGVGDMHPPAPEDVSAIVGEVE